MAGAMYFTKPNLEDFKSFAQEAMEKRMSEEETLAEYQGLQEGLGTLGKEMIGLFTRETDLVLCRVYTVNFGQKNYRYVGVFKIFIPLQIANPLDDEFEKY